MAQNSSLGMLQGLIKCRRSRGHRAKMSLAFMPWDTCLSILEIPTRQLRLFEQILVLAFDHR